MATEHEKGTMQSYFSEAKIERLFDGHFDIVENYLIRRTDVATGNFHGRYHVIARNLKGS